MDFANILKDEATFPDTAEITLGAEKVTLGQIRDLSRQQQRAISEQVDALTRDRNEVKELATKAADLYSKAQAAVEAQPKPQPTTPDDFDADPWWEPVRKKFKSAVDPLQQTLNDLKAAVDAQKAATERAASIWANDRWKSQYASVKDRLKSPKYADYTFEKTRDYAAQNRILDEYGFPDIGKAVEAITREDELDRIKREAREEGIREGMTKGRMATMQRPTSAAGVKSKEPGLDPSKNLEDLGDSVASDPEIMKMLSELGGIDPSDIVQ